MLSSMRTETTPDPTDILQEALEADGGGHVELRYHSKRTRSVSVEKGRVDQVLLAEHTGVGVRVLAGGTAAWAAAGLPMATGFKEQLDDPIDVWYRPYDLDEGNEAAMKTYLSWEVDLTDQIVRDGTARFPEFSL